MGQEHFHHLNLAIGRTKGIAGEVLVDFANPANSTFGAGAKHEYNGVIHVDDFTEAAQGAGELGQAAVESLSDLKGNAVDAAVATGFALTVVHPQAGNIGGGGFIVLRTKDGKVTTFDFREKAPLAASPAMFLDEQGKIRDNANHQGIMSVGVPGSVAGLELAHNRTSQTHEPFPVVLDEVTEGLFQILTDIKKIQRLPVVNFAAGGVATPADAALMMQLGVDGVFCSNESTTFGMLRALQTARLASQFGQEVKAIETRMQLAHLAPEQAGQLLQQLLRARVDLHHAVFVVKNHHPIAQVVDHRVARQRRQSQ